MGRFIAKIDGYYVEYSTVVDAPVTYPLTLEEFTAYYREEYGENGMRELPSRMERVEAKGTSSMRDKDVDEMLIGNRMGENERCLSREEITSKIKSMRAEYESQT